MKSFVPEADHQSQEAGLETKFPEFIVQLDLHTSSDSCGRLGLGRRMTRRLGQPDWAGEGDFVSSELPEQRLPCPPLCCLVLEMPLVGNMVPSLREVRLELGKLQREEGNAWLHLPGSSSWCWRKGQMEVWRDPRTDRQEALRLRCPPPGGWCPQALAWCLPLVGWLWDMFLFCDIFLVFLSIPLNINISNPVNIRSCIISYPSLLTFSIFLREHPNSLSREAYYG